MTTPSIQAPNYTQIPNVIFDHWMAILSPGAFKVLICMCRKIFGWHKTSDTISKNQIIKVTGLSKNSVQSAIEELENHGLVLKFQHQNEYGHQPNTYALNVEKPKDELYQDPNLPGGGQNFRGGGSKYDLGVGQNLTQGVGQNLTPQKKDYTKERLTKDNTPPNPLKGEDGGQSFSPSSAEKKQKKAELEPEKIQVREHVVLSPEEHAKLLADYGEAKLNQMLDTLDVYKGSTGKRYKSDYHTLLPAGWVHKRWLEEKDKPSSSTVAKHRQGSKLAFETEKDTWRPPEAKTRERTPEEKARIKKEFGVDL
jgi:phage replication O-like protein O